jgi:uncharacterized protein
MQQQKDFLGRGWAFPIRLDDRTAGVELVEDEEDVKQSILIILSTARGERVMRPDFGCGIHDLVFESLDTTTVERVRTETGDALRRYEPRIEVLAVTVDLTEAGSDGRLEIGIDYRVRATNQAGNLVYPFYFKEGAAG